MSCILLQRQQGHPQRMKMELKAKSSITCSSTSRIITDTSEHLGERRTGKKWRRRYTWSRPLLTTDKQQQEDTELANLLLGSNKCPFLTFTLVLVLVWGNRARRGKKEGEKLIEMWAAIEPDWCHQHLGHAKHFRALTEHTPYTGFGRPDRWGWTLTAHTEVPAIDKSIKSLQWNATVLSWEASFGANLGDGAENPVGFSWGRYFAADQHPHQMGTWAGWTG